MKLVHTTVAIDHLRGHEQATALLLDLAVREALIASEVTRFELLVGLRPDEEAAMERYFRLLTWIPVDEEVARKAGALARRYRREFPRIDDVDYLIAATAVAVDAELLTLNVRDFPMFPNLQRPY